MSKKKVDFLVTIILLAIGATVSFYLKPPNPLLGLLYLGIPSFFLMWRQKKELQKDRLGSFDFWSFDGLSF